MPACMMPRTNAAVSRHAILSISSIQPRSALAMVKDVLPDRAISGTALPCIDASLPVRPKRHTFAHPKDMSHPPTNEPTPAEDQDLTPRKQ